MKSSREQFEEWWDGFTFSRSGRCKSLRSGEGYRNEAADECYKAWQASRQALANEEVTTASFIKVSE